MRTNPESGEPDESEGVEDDLPEPAPVPATAATDPSTPEQRPQLQPLLPSIHQAKERVGMQDTPHNAAKRRYHGPRESMRSVGRPVIDFESE